MFVLFPMSALLILVTLQYICGLVARASTRHAEGSGVRFPHQHIPRLFCLRICCAGVDLCCLKFHCNTLGWITVPSFLRVHTKMFAVLNMVLPLPPPPPPHYCSYSLGFFLLLSAPSFHCKLNIPCTFPVRTKYV